MSINAPEIGTSNTDKFGTLNFKYDVCWNKRWPWEILSFSFEEIKGNKRKLPSSLSSISLSCHLWYSNLKRCHACQWLAPQQLEKMEVGLLWIMLAESLTWMILITKNTMVKSFLFSRFSLSSGQKKRLSYDDFSILTMYLLKTGLWGHCPLLIDLGREDHLNGIHPPTYASERRKAVLCS